MLPSDEGVKKKKTYPRKIKTLEVIAYKPVVAAEIKLNFIKEHNARYIRPGSRRGRCFLCAVELSPASFSFQATNDKEIISVSVLNSQARTPYTTCRAAATTVKIKGP